MTSETERWIKAGMRLAANPTAATTCPRCGDATLEVEDVRAGDRVERHLRCPRCGGYNAILIPSEEHRSNTLLD